MKTGFSVFLAAGAAMGLSWIGFVYAPLVQLGGAKQTLVLQSTDKWPLSRTGDATLGAQVYRAYGCAACHSQQVRQNGTAFAVTVTDLGAHSSADFIAFMKSLPTPAESAANGGGLTADLKDWKGELPKTILTCDDQAAAEVMANRLKASGVKFETRIVANGPDIARGWGVRQSVAADYLYDQPVQLGALRAGPDLSNIALRVPDAAWQWLHLYAPKAVVSDSAMPAFRFLFEVRKITGATSSPDALKLTGAFAPPAGFEVVPKAEAKELVAYLLSLKSNAPLFEAPFTPLSK